MKRKVFSFVFALILCLGLAIPVSAAESNQQNPKYGRDPNNYSGRGSFVKDEEYFYYVSRGKYNETTRQFQPDKIVKQSIDGQNKTVIYTSNTQIGNEPVPLTGSLINLMDEYLYFKDGYDNIYRLKTDGTFVDCIYQRDPNRNDYIFNIRQMLVIDDRLYLTWDNDTTHQTDLISMKLDGSDIKTVENKNFTTNFVAYGEWLYFENTGQYFCYNIHTGATNTVRLPKGNNEFDGEYIGYVNLEGISADGRVHYTEVYTLPGVVVWKFFGDHYSSMPDGTDWRREKSLAGNNLSYLIVGNDYLYYSDDCYIYKSSLYDEDSPVRIMDRPVENGSGLGFGYHNGYINDYNDYYDFGFYRVVN